MLTEHNACHSDYLVAPLPRGIYDSPRDGKDLERHWPLVPFTVVAMWLVVATIRVAVALEGVRADTTSLSLQNWQHPQRYGA